MASDGDSEPKWDRPANITEAYDRISVLQASAEDPDEPVQFDVGEATGLKVRNSIKIYVLPPNSRFQRERPLILSPCRSSNDNSLSSFGPFEA
jgi:hypothetical protein